MKKSLIQLKNETVKNGKFNNKAIFDLAWDRVRQGIFKSIGKALKYAWSLANDVVSELKQKALGLNADFSSFTKFS